ncbi:MAG: ABC transporter permease [Candidatus Cyclobacteriaceae bacterium M3_2C_046]
MLKNYLHNLLNHLWKHKAKSLVLIFSIGLGLVLFICSVGMLDLLTNDLAPEVNRTRTLYLNQVKYLDQGEWVFRNNEDFNDKFTSDFLLQHIKTMETPARVSIYHHPITTSFGDQFEEKRFRFSATDADFWEILEFEFLQGKPYTQNQVNQGDPVAVIDTKLSNYLFGTPQSLGLQFKKWGRTFTVIGVITAVNPLSEVAANFYIPFTAYPMDENKFNRIDQRDVYYSRGYYKALLLADNSSQFSVIQQELAKITSQLNQTGKVEEFQGIAPALNDRWQNLALVFDMPYLDFGMIAFFLFLYLVIIAIPITTIMKLNHAFTKDRFEEIGIRRSFGAGRKNLLQQLLFENFLLTLLGGLVGFFLARLIFSSVVRILFRGIEAPSFGINNQFLLMALAVLLLFSLLTGYLPARKMARLHPIFALSKGRSHRPDQSVRSGNTLSGLVVGVLFTGQIVLLFGVVKQLLPRLDTMWLSQINGYGLFLKSEQPDLYEDGFEQLKSNLKRIEGVKNVSFTYEAIPFSVMWNMKKFDTPTGEHQVKLLSIDQEYDDILNFKCQFGRWFKSGDHNLDLKPAILSPQTAKKFFGQKNCVGKTFSDLDHQQYQVIGVAEKKDLRAAGDKYRIFILDKGPLYHALMELEAGVDFAKVKDDLNALFSASGPIELDHFLSLRETYQKYISHIMVWVKAVGVLVGLLILNVAIGFFAVGWSQIRSRQQEIGVRRAMGATRKKVKSMLLHEHLKLGLIAIGIAMIPLSQLIYFTSRNDPQAFTHWLYAFSFAFLFTFAMLGLAVWAPAWRAGRITPVKALMNE